MTTKLQVSCLCREKRPITQYSEFNSEYEPCTCGCGYSVRKFSLENNMDDDLRKEAQDNLDYQNKKSIGWTTL